MAGRACLSELQDQGGLADESLERIVRRALEEARAKRRDELTQANSVRRPSPTLEFSKSWLASMSEVAQNRKILRGARNVQSWG